MNSELPPQKPKRRPRYPGKYPRLFQHKYKELSPTAFPETIQKVLEAGKTPAGIHRPICVNEILDILDPQPGKIAVDATLGYGGHAREILPRLLPGGKLIGLDVDPLELTKTQKRLAEDGFGPDCLVTVHSNFAGLSKIIANQQLPGADIILADLGCSSMQYDNPERGFSYKFAGPLDMRLNPLQGRPVSDWLSQVQLSQLAEVLAQHSDEPRAMLLATAILQAHTAQPLLTTDHLARVIKKTLVKQAKSEIEASLKRVFQALRIAINDEFGALSQFLRFLPMCLAAGGRAAILTFHSGEDRRVKQAFQNGLESGFYDEISQSVIRPGPDEVRSNPRAGSAQLRWAQRSSVPFYP
jgi:16S rRNA (cytosine1402-N4)-methyltransferase